MKVRCHGERGGSWNLGYSEVVSHKAARIRCELQTSIHTKKCKIQHHPWYFAGLNRSMPTICLLLALQVETIGDAYMVVGGVPVPVTSHAERVANFALGMRIAAREVMSPITDKPIQVIGT